MRLAPNPALHAAAGTLALLMVASFWIASVVAEFALDTQAVRSVKHVVVAGLFVLVPALAVAGIGGALAARGGQRAALAVVKQRRMKRIAANGLLLMLPCALWLDAQAGAGRFDTAFYAVQALELTVGLVQMGLLALNLRDGIRMRRRGAAAG